MERTQREMVLDYLKTHEGITSLEAYRMFGIIQMPKRIFDLRKSGYEITTKNEVGLNRFGKEVRFVRYSLANKEQL